MKFYKILFFFVLFLLMFIPISKCDFETSDIDINTIGDNYNNNSYVVALANIGVKVTASQSNNVIVLTYNDSESLIYTYNESDGVFSTSYSSLNNEHLDILNAIFIDTISTMQGNASGIQLSAAFDDTFCFSTLKDNGISKNYLSDDGSSITVDFKINPSIKLPVPQIDSSIKEEDFYKEYETLYEKEDTIVKAQGLLFLKSYDENGNLIIYIAQPTELNDYAYDSVLTGLKILLTNNATDSEKLSYYFKQNYSDFTIGNKDFDGVSIDLNVESLPVSTPDTVLVTSDTKYAKFTISENIVKEKIADITLPSVSQNDGVKANSSKLFLMILIPILILLIIGGIVYKVKKS